MTTNILTTRNENVAVGQVAKSGRGSKHAAQAIIECLLDKSPLLVVMADNGGVFALDARDMRIQEITKTKPECIVGVYTKRSTCKQLWGDLRERAGELLA